MILFGTAYLQPSEEEAGGGVCAPDGGVEGIDPLMQAEEYFARVKGNQAGHVPVP